MIAGLIELLKTSFFLQGSYAFTYAPLMILLVTAALYWFANIRFVVSFLIALQCVLSAYIIMIILSAAIAFIATYYDYPLISHGMKRPLHYHAAIILSVLLYYPLEVLLLLTQKQRIHISIALLLLICNLIAAAIMIGLHLLLFVRHV